jgi:plastocyanin
MSGRVARLAVTPARLAAPALAALIAASAPAAAETVRVTMADLVFAPHEVTAKVGDTVEFVNDDILLHSATDRARSFDLVIKPQETARLPLQKPGRLSYYCRYHPNMTGEITVNP